MIDLQKMNEDLKKVKKELDSHQSSAAVVGLRELKDENIKLGEKVIELSKQLGIEKSNYDELFKFFNEKYPDDMQGFFKPE